ncbi:MAG TPA: penicillin-binding transpeptidase domain-containing protein, partial [Candidatus Solibacter sp.]|nr:penicillin-binding transpeptidase domain-containing protein [Candidatus Solibacter sp.]
SGEGIGQGEAQMVPAAHTDLVLAAAGEEGGFLLVALIFALYTYIVWRSLRIALRARTDYEFFLAAGLAAVTALQILLIAGGSLGVLPLSGVVTPFLSFGRTATIANCAVFAILLSISARPGEAERNAPFRVPAYAAGLIFAGLGAAVVAKAAMVQVVNSGATVGAGTLVVQADGGRRYQYNPRLQEIMREIPKGTIYDRNGIPLATSDWNELEKHRADYRSLGIDIDAACRRTDLRHYPFAGLTFDLLGDLRTRTRWGASNTSFVERDSARRLRGYDDRPTIVEVKNPSTGQMDRVLRYDYRELLPLLRHRHEPNNPEVRRVLDRPRDVKMSVDTRLQMQLANILRARLQQAHVDKGAAVVLDPSNGDLLASVSLPLPEPGDVQPEGNPFMDRARYGLYPPGSTFKVVTAIAALRKDPQLIHKQYQCISLGDGRVGNYIHGSKRPIRDDVKDTAPHGTLDLERGLTVSCNAYFAQLGTYDVGADALHDTAILLGIAASSPDTAAELKKSLPQSSYGQGEVVASPFQMARVAAAVANGGQMPQGRWIVDDTNSRVSPPAAVLPADAANLLGKFMREVVTQGTGRAAAASQLACAGKTGTAELANAASHAWFMGYAPYTGGARKIAFAVLVENGVYGGTAAAPAAPEIIAAAAKLGFIR